MSLAAVTLENLSHRYGRHWALLGVSFSSMSGETVAVLGPNGCGKSTLLKILATRLEPTRGRGSLLGFDLKKEVAPLRKEIEWLGHELGLYKALTAEENLKFSSSLRGKRPDTKAIHHILAHVGLQKKEDRPVASFSMGMRKRLSLGRILLHQPRLILLDEPHANLDRKGKQLMHECIAQWKREEKTLLLAFHDHSEMFSLCDKALVLNEGKTVYFGDAGKIPPDVIL